MCENLYDIYKYLDHVFLCPLKTHFEISNLFWEEKIVTLISSNDGDELKLNLAREPKTSGADQCRGSSDNNLFRTSKLEINKK